MIIGSAQGFISGFGEPMLRKRIAQPLACFLAIASTISFPAQGQVWDFLGVTEIDGTRDHEKIEVTRRNGVFHAIQFRVSGDAIFFDRVVVHFGDGTSKRWPFKAGFGRKGETTSSASPANVASSKASRSGITRRLGSTIQE